MGPAWRVNDHRWIVGHHGAAERLGLIAAITPALLIGPILQAFAVAMVGEVRHQGPGTSAETGGQQQERQPVARHHSSPPSAPAGASTDSPESRPSGPSVAITLASGWWAARLASALISRSQAVHNFSASTFR